MSMLGSQCDELRTLADKLRDVRLDDQVNYAESVETMFRAMGAMREAADIIESLRDRLQAAELGSGTCEMKTDWDYLHDGIPDAPEDTWAYKCSACGWSFRYDRGIKPNFCPNCCARVKAVER